MQLIDEGILINKIDFSESSLIATFLTKDNGVQKGLLKGAKTIKSKYLNEVGINILNINKRYKTENSLGYCSLSIRKSFLLNIFYDINKLKVISTMCSMLYTLTVENNNYAKLYNATIALINLIANSNNKNLYIANYIKWEILLLSEIGMGIDFSKCAITNSAMEELYYVSKKTGKSVIKQVGEKYKSQCYVIPKFLVENSYKSPSKNDIQKGYNISTYFLNKFCRNYNKQLPIIRKSTILN